MVTTPRSEFRSGCLDQFWRAEVGKFSRAPKGLRVYKELMPMKKEQVDLENAVVWIPDSKTPNGIAEVPLTDLAREAFREQIRISGPGTWLFPNDESSTGYQNSLKTVWRLPLRRA